MPYVPWLVKPALLPNAILLSLVRKLAVSTAPTILLFIPSTSSVLSSPKTLPVKSPVKLGEFCVYAANLSSATSTVVGALPSHTTPAFAGYGIVPLTP